MKYADDTVVVGLINKDNDESLYFDTVCTVNDWCKDHYLNLNVSKTKEIIIDFRRSSNDKLPMTINGSAVEVVHSYKYLGIYVQDDLKWDSHCKYVIGNLHRRMYYVRCLKNVGVNTNIISMFYNSVVASAMCYGVVCWWNSCTKKQQHDFMKLRKRATRISKNDLLCDPNDAYTATCQRMAVKIFEDESHPLRKYINFLPHGARLRVPLCRTVRFKKSFMPQAIIIDLLNVIKPWTVSRSQ
jgi:hypothetical protein